MFVTDINGNTNLVPMMTLQMDTAQSFTPLVQLKVVDTFDPENEAVMLASFSDKLSKKKFSGEGTIKLTSSRPNKLTYTANVNGDQLAVFSEIYYPNGWKVTIDGKEVKEFRANFVLRGLSIPAGKHTIEFKFEPEIVKKGSSIALFSSIGMLLLLLGGIYFERKNKIN